MDDKNLLHVLIVEDSPDDAFLLVRDLKKEGFCVESLRVQSETEMRGALQKDQWDLVISDHALPGFSDMAALQLTRERDLDLPFIILSGAISDAQAVQAMRSGAQDYIMKGNSARLMPAIRRELAEAEQRRAKRAVELELDKQELAAAKALEEAYHELQKAYDMTLWGWVRALELRDKETEGHSLRVVDLTMLLAKKLGLPPEKMEHIRRGALLHDIGKLGVPDAILLKPGPLTPAEWCVMKQHPVYAHDWMEPIGYLQPALAIPWCHHERWDGSGYPLGLAGTEISLEARIFALVDVLDALRSDRPYRPAWDEKRILDHLREESGKQFDPQVVETFFAIHQPVALEKG